VYGMLEIADRADGLPVRDGRVILYPPRVGAEADTLSP